MQDLHVEPDSGEGVDAVFVGDNSVFVTVVLGEDDTEGFQLFGGLNVGGVQVSAVTTKIMHVKVKFVS